MNKEKIKLFLEKLKRQPESHKYNYGHILVIAGSKFMPGAGILSCNAVMRSGAGLVTYAITEDFLNSAIAASKPETIFFAYKNADDLLDYINKRKISSVIIGPGLIESEKTRKLISVLINQITIPVVLDASGLVSFAGRYGELKKATAKLILTPHTGEFTKLIGKNNSSKLTDGKIGPRLNENDSEFIVKKFAMENNLILVLKRHNTLVSDGKDIYINQSGTPAMASAGSGDVLSGIIGALTSINKDLFEAVCFAVFIHGLAGEIAEKEKGNGLISSDIIETIPFAFKKLKTINHR